MHKIVSIKQSKPAVRQVTINHVNAGQRLDNFLISACKGVPKSHIYKAIRAGQVRINKGRCKADTRLADGDIVRIPPLRLPEPNVKRPVPAGDFPILYEDKHLLVINKPAGVAVHGGSGVSFGVIEQIRAARPTEPMLELAHRLDRETSGVLMLARSRKALVGLHAIMRNGEARKHYLALVVGDWVNDRQHIKLPLHKYLTKSGERRVRVADEGKFAHTIITLKHRYQGAYSLVGAELRTGRTHQIRVHLAYSGFPIAGDEKYGTEQARNFLLAHGLRRMFLHAHQLHINHPVTGESLNFTAELPPDCAAFLQQLESINGK